MASFTHEKMNIAISSGNVLESKVSNAQVSINNFADHINILNISGNIAGKASDGIKHANYKSAFAAEIEKYLSYTFSSNSIHSSKHQIKKCFNIRSFKENMK